MKILPGLLPEEPLRPPDFLPRCDLLLPYAADQYDTVPHSDKYEGSHHILHAIEQAIDTPEPDDNQQKPQVLATVCIIFCKKADLLLPYARYDHRHGYQRKQAY